MRKQKRTDALAPRACFPRSRTPPVSSLRTSHAASNAARDADDSRISVTAVAGDVEVTMAGHAATCRRTRPCCCRLASSRGTTGRSVSRRRARTSACRTTRTSRFPRRPSTATSSPGWCSTAATCSMTSRRAIVGKLRVETPLLVAVIKGTQFNVAVQPDSTTISLFEGRLEIRTPDDTDVVQLNAGEIAIRSLHRRRDSRRRHGRRRASPRRERRQPAVAVAAARGSSSRRRAWSHLTNDDRARERRRDLRAAVAPTWALPRSRSSAAGSISAYAAGTDDRRQRRRHDGQRQRHARRRERRRSTRESTSAAAVVDVGWTRASTWAVPRSTWGSIRVSISAAARSTSVSAPVSMSAARAWTSGSIRASISAAAPSI